MQPSRQYCKGPVQAVIFDWAGTIVDYGSYAPTKVLIEAFAERGVAVSLLEARVPMGLPKWDHIHALGRLPEVAARWRARYGRDLNTADVDALYARFMPLHDLVCEIHGRALACAMRSLYLRFTRASRQVWPNG